ncbi:MULTISPECIES: hypothetical protein [Microbacterium]|uniref:Uncharacterized protein n=1 Tax=Microbacterium wangchenii TaxID=2541726 RepID=A0ABX5SQS1_9MICO|nr:MULTISPECIES: hypothetical protein [Microbacterium]MCK6068221.1 hypothetical protein [Microbacterium sp. EYE_512]QBR87508.1 hypothetical protein E4K62_01645 [Microbacterium wangchenii]TXK15777.1 hypothetical protein FVP99_09745 [Microbacterium wangchenii]
MNIYVVAATRPEGGVAYHLEHDYDTDIFTDLPGDGPFPTLDLAEAASGRLADALACVND